MPKAQLILMGLLSKYPNKSRVLQRFVTAPVGIKYTDRERMHITATWWTPGIPGSWLRHQFEQYGLDGDAAVKRMEKIALKPKNRDRWKHIGERNVLFMGQPEVDRFFLRRPPHKLLYVPTWALPVLNDYLKQGKTKAWIRRRYGINDVTIYQIFRRSMFDGSNRGNPDWKKGSR